VLFLTGSLFALASLSFGQKHVKVDQNKDKDDVTVITLNECWRYRSPDVLVLRPAVDKSNLYVAENGGRVSAISLASGIRLWSSELGGEIRSNIAVQGASVFAVTSDGSKRMRLRGLSLVSGIPASDIELPYSANARIESAGGKLVVALDTGYVASFAAGGQKPEWQTTVPNIDISNIVVLNGNIIAAGSDKTIHVVSIADGKAIATTPVENTISAFGVYDSDLVVGDNRGNLTRYDDDYRTVYWRFRNGARISSIVPTEQGVMAASLDNFVYMASGYYGDVRWKKRMAGRVSSLVADGNIAVALTVGEPLAVILNLDNGKSSGEFAIGDDDSFTQPAIAAEGKLLFFTTSQILAESVKPCPAK
jgi:outer membrane protein assembly factor BamB